MGCDVELSFHYLPFRTASRNCPKRGTGKAPSVILAGMRRPKWTAKPLYGGPLGYIVGASEASRTVSRGAPVADRRRPPLPLDLSHQRRVDDHVPDRLDRGHVRGPEQTVRLDVDGHLAAVAAGRGGSAP
jgi:hypothetical protein